MVEKKSNKTRDLLLGLLSASGLAWLINSLFTGYFVLNQINKTGNLSIMRIIAITELLLYIIGTVLISKKIEVSTDYKRWFIIFAIIVFAGQLIWSLLIFI